MCDERSEQPVDAELRNVKLPPGLMARLKAVTEPTNNEIDAALRGLELPQGLASRLKFVLEEEALDESLRAVDVPADLLARLRIIPERRRESPLRRFVLAASLLLIMTGSFFGAIGGILASIRPLANQSTSLPVIEVGPTQLVALPPEPVRLSNDLATELFATRTTPVVWKGGPLRVDLVRLDETTTPGPAGQLIRDVARGLQLGSDVLLMRWGTYASPQQLTQRLPELERIRREPLAGVDLPLVSGYDRAFLHRSATHPPVFLAADERLQSIHVPLSTSTASFQRAEQLVGIGRVPEQQEIRLEDFLAAVEYGFPLPRDEDVSVTNCAGPAPFSSQKHVLVQVGVRATRRLGNLPTHVSVAVDVSQSMLEQGRIEAVRVALEKMFEHLDADDSVSLIAVNHEVTQQLDFASADEQDLLDAWINSLRVGGGDRPVAGIQAALSLAREAPRGDGVLRQIVFVTDGAAKPSLDEQKELNRLLANAKESKIQTTMLRIDDGTSTGATSTGATGPGDDEYASISPNDLPWKLVELVSGVSSVIALDAQARVVFNPKAIKAYRLVGHGPSSSTGLGDDVWESDLRSGQEATLLFEVWAHDSYEDELATVTVQWTSPNTIGWKESRRASLDRYDVATRLSESAPTLRSAAIAAEIGARLQGIGSFELRSGQNFRSRRKPASWQEVITAASELTAEVSISEDFLRLLELARKLEALRRPSEPSTTL